MKKPLRISFFSGEMPDLERSVSSTKPHTVNVNTDAEEESVPTVHILPTNPTGTQNLGILNSTAPVRDELPISVIRSIQNESNDYVA